MLLDPDRLFLITCLCTRAVNWDLWVQAESSLERTHWASMLSPSQALIAKHVLYPQLTATAGKVLYRTRESKGGESTSPQKVGTHSSTTVHPLAALECIASINEQTCSLLGRLLVLFKDTCYTWSAKYTCLLHFVQYIVECQRGGVSNKPVDFNSPHNPSQPFPEKRVIL